jgi:hypothetical protein
MINDPHIEIINKTRSLHLDETLVEQSIDKFLKQGASQALFFLVHDKKIPEGDASKLTETIKKEFRSTYFLTALCMGVFMILSLTLLIVFIQEADITSIWLYPVSAIFSYFTYATIKNLLKGLRIR